MNKLEFLVDALGHINGADNPLADAYKLKNPLLLKSYARPGKHDVDDEGRRRFASRLAGLKAALFDIELKVSGKSRAGLKPTDGIENLCRVYGISQKLGIEKVVAYLKVALSDPTITARTPLSYFYGEEKR